MQNGSKSAFRMKWGSLLFVIFISLIAASHAHAAEGDKIEVYVDKHKVEFSIDPYAFEGTTLVQLRPLFESLGIEVGWDGETGTVTGKKGDERFSLTLGHNTATVNGRTVSLAQPSRAIDGHTLVPLRFVSEAAGAEVGWHGETSTIQVYSSEYIQIMGITRDEARQAVASAPPAAPSGTETGLRGFYARSSLDLLNTRGCGGVCWDYYYFFNDHQFTIQPPDSRMENIDCTREQCMNYTIQDGRLIVDGEVSYPLEIFEEGITVNGDYYNRHEPLYRPKLDGTYVASGYTGLLGGGGFASSSTFIFRPDGTFYDDSFIVLITDGSDFGDRTGVSTTHLSDSEAAGRYTVINHTILLEYEDGNVESYLFFRPDQDDNMYKIGGRDFIITESIEFDEEYEQRREEETRITEPLPDKLLTDGIADKTVIKQRNTGESDRMGVAEIRLESYQWAELDIRPEHLDIFTGFGDGPITALTVKYEIINQASEGLDLSTLKSVVWVYDGYVPETVTLSPTEAGILEEGESEERLAVFLFPSELLKNYDRYELVFSDLTTEYGYEAFHGYELDFQLAAPY